MQEVQLYLFDTNSYSFDELIELFVVAPNQLNDVKQYKIEEGRKEHLISTYLKNCYVKNYYLNEKGKPISKDVKFNISHSHGIVVLALNKDREIGVDIELVRPSSNELKSRICSDFEYNFATDDEKFMSIWTAKEAFLKMTGDGLIHDLKSINVLPLNSLKIIKNCSVFEKTININGYVISICLDGTNDFEYKINFLK
jgi:phosphopantetheinyl transferase